MDNRPDARNFFSHLKFFDIFSNNQKYSGGVASEHNFLKMFL